MTRGRKPDSIEAMRLRGASGLRKRRSRLRQSRAKPDANRVPEYPSGGTIRLVTDDDLLNADDLILSVGALTEKRRLQRKRAAAKS